MTRAERDLRYREAHREQYREHARAWREANPDKVIAYQEANREQARKYAREYAARRRAREAGTDDE